MDSRSSQMQLILYLTVRSHRGPYVEGLHNSGPLPVLGSTNFVPFEGELSTEMYPKSLRSLLTGENLN